MRGRGPIECAAVRSVLPERGHPPEPRPPGWRSLAEWLAPYAVDMTDQDIDRIADDLRRAREEAKRG